MRDESVEMRDESGEIRDECGEWRGDESGKLEWKTRGGGMRARGEERRK